VRATTIVARAREAGIVGAGGAGFPTHVKLAANVDTVIGNGAECEPLLRVDQQLMAIEPEAVVKGLALAREATGAQRAILALKRKYHDALQALRAPAADFGVEIFPLDNFYPAGDEITLIREVIDRSIPAGQIPLAGQTVVSNVGTLYNLAMADSAQTPVTHRWVTVAGAVKTPQTFIAPIGISISELIRAAGGASVERWVYLAGGPMMGSVQTNLERTLAKTDSGIIVLPEDHYLIKKKRLSFSKMAKKARTVCVQCVACTDVCPRYLLGHDLRPHVIMRQVGYGMQLDAETLRSVFLCCECGACTYFACPMDLSPGAINGYLKRELASQGIRGPQGTSEPPASLLREFRKIPVKRLISRLHLGHYDLPAPLLPEPLKPKLVRLALQQHIGSPAEPVVEKGTKVKTGDLIAEIPVDKLGARLHASIDGMVNRVTKQFIEIKG